jgi:hypothetical protein
MSSNDIQLEMNFSEKQNRFRKTVEQGEFVLLIESAVPGPQLTSREVLKQLQALENTVLGIDGINCGLAILDKSSNREGWSAIEYAGKLSDKIYMLKNFDFRRKR